MTEQDCLDLDNKVAELYGIAAYVEIEHHKGKLTGFEEVPLRQDWARLMPLAIEHGISYTAPIEWGDSYKTSAKFWMWDVEVYQQKFITEWGKDHHTKEIAVAVAIERALVAKKESEKL